MSLEKELFYDGVVVHDAAMQPTVFPCAVNLTNSFGIASSVVVCYHS